MDEKEKHALKKKDIEKFSKRPVGAKVIEALEKAGVKKDNFGPGELNLISDINQAKELINID